jgi:hypothetical protein
MGSSNRTSTDGRRITVVEGDALSVHTDLLVLKYAQQSYGADAAARAALAAIYPAIESELPLPGQHVVYDTCQTLEAKRVLFIGVPRLAAFGYKEMRTFGQDALEIAAREYPEVRSIALTVHGPGYGLDELECFNSLVAGLLDNVAEGTAPRGLEQIALIEKAERRAKRFCEELDRLLGSASVDVTRAGTITSTLTRDVLDKLRSVGDASASKPLLFVAMPFREDMADHYDYGILRAAERAGYLCERADQAHFTGDVLEWVRARIDAATLVVADLSYANPNVYLEVGYAWGRGKPALLMVRDTEDLKFDVRGQRCLIYKRIKDLEEKLHTELVHLFRT